MPIVIFKNASIYDYHLIVSIDFKLIHLKLSTKIKRENFR